MSRSRVPARDPLPEDPGHQAKHQRRHQVDRAQTEGRLLEEGDRLVVERRVGGEPAEKSGRQDDPLLFREPPSKAEMHERSDEEAAGDVHDQRSGGKRLSPETNRAEGDEVAAARPKGAGQTDEEELPHRRRSSMARRISTDGDSRVTKSAPWVGARCAEASAWRAANHSKLEKVS